MHTILWACRRGAAMAAMPARGAANGGVLPLLPRYLLKALRILPMLFLWEVLLQEGAHVDMTLNQARSYTVLGTALSGILTIMTPASGWNYEGKLLNLFLRPMGVLRQLTCQTLGGWLPEFPGFSLPVIGIAALLGVPLLPASGWFFPSLLLCVSLGFAVDYLFVCLAIRMQGASYQVQSIRAALAAILSGSVIPFAAMPELLGNALAYQPFGSLAAAPLAIFTGLAPDPAWTVFIQMLWNAVLWPLALFCFSHSQERMVSYGG